MLTVYSHYLSSDKWSNLGQPGADNKKIQNFFLQWPIFFHTHKISNILEFFFIKDQYMK